MHAHLVTSYIYRFLCGVLVFDSVSRSRSRSRPLRPASPTIFHTQLCHTLSFTHNFVTHSLSHATLSHTLFHTPSLSHTLFHAQLCHTLSFTLSLSHTIFHTQLCHTPSFTHNLVTHSLSHTDLSHTLSNTALSHTLFHTQLFYALSFTHHLCHTLSFTHYLCHTRHPPSICVAGVALGDIRPHLVWQALTWRHPPSFRVAGVALMALGWPWWRAWARLGRRWSRGDAAWQAWRLATCTFVSRGRRRTYGTGLALVARLGAAHDVADGERMGRHLQPAATDRFSLGGSILLAHERYGWWSDGLRRVACNTVFAVFNCCVASVFGLRTPSFTHNFVTHSLSHTIFVTHSVSRTTLSHTLFHTLSLSRTIFHTQLCHTPSFTHNFVAHSLSHTALSHTIFHTQLCHTPSFTHDFITHNSSHTTFLTSRSSTTSFVFPSFPVPLQHVLLIIGRS